MICCIISQYIISCHAIYQKISNCWLLPQCFMFKLSLTTRLHFDAIWTLYKRSGDCLNLYAILGNTDLEWLLIQLFRIYMSSPWCKSWWDNNQLPAFGLFVISSPRRCLCCLWSVQQGSSRSVLQFHIGFLVLSAFYSVAVTWPVTEC